MRPLDAPVTVLPDQQHYDEVPFPVVRQLTAGATRDEAIEWVRTHRDKLTDELKAAGAILFRGFPLRDASDFDAFVAAFDYPNFTYAESLSNAVRVNLTDRVFTANEAPASVRIHLHHEMAQTPVYPSRLFFFCEQPAESGGETPLCRSDVLLEELARLEPNFVANCNSLGLRYRTVMPPANDASSGMGRSWQSTLRAETREQADARLAALGYTGEWLEGDCLRATTPVLPAIRTLPDGRRTFFNQLIAAAAGWKDSRNDPGKAITFGDDTPLDQSAVQTAVELADALSFDVPWQAGDVALVDNFAVMHARRPFEGTRRVLASLVAADAE